MTNENFSNTPKGYASSMKVALLGAPGSGKSKLAARLARRLNTKGPLWDPPAPRPGGQWKVIDDYVGKVTPDAGPIFDRSVYPINIQIASQRWILERQAASKHQSTITCGTIFETIIYAAAHGLTLNRIPDESLFFEEAEISKQMMESFATLAMITFDYDALFYLPHPGETEKTWNSVINAKLPEVLEGAMKQAIVLRGPLKNQCNEAYDIIKQIFQTLSSTASHSE